LSLDEFQARYTSEDNSSFTQILDDENRKRKEQWAWAWDAQKRVEEQREKMIEVRERGLIEMGPGVKERFAIEAPVSAGFITDGMCEGEKEAANGVCKEVVETPAKVIGLEQGEELDVMAPKKDTRSAGVDAWKFKTRNSLMFSPDADTSPYHPPLNKTDAGGDPKSISHLSTRLPSQEDSSILLRAMSEPPSPTRSRIDAAISGTPCKSSLLSLH
jgi:protein DGCR14